MSGLTFLIPLSVAAAVLAPVASAGIVLTQALTVDERKSLEENIQASSTTTFSKDFLCDPSKPSCTVTIEVLPVPDPNDAKKIYCNASIGTISFEDTKRQNPWKRIVWELGTTKWVAPAPAGRFEFHETHGIAFIENPNKQIIVRGQGDGSEDDPAKFHATNKHREKHVLPDGTVKPAVYLPFIIFHPTGGGDPSTCSAFDPKVVNN